MLTLSPRLLNRLKLLKSIFGKFEFCLKAKFRIRFAIKFEKHFQFSHFWALPNPKCCLFFLSKLRDRKFCLVSIYIFIHINISSKDWQEMLKCVAYVTRVWLCLAAKCNIRSIKYCVTCTIASKSVWKKCGDFCLSPFFKINFDIFSAIAPF